METILTSLDRGTATAPLDTIRNSGARACRSRSTGDRRAGQWRQRRHCASGNGRRQGRPEEAWQGLGQGWQQAEFQFQNGVEHNYHGSSDDHDHCSSANHDYCGPTNLDHRGPHHHNHNTPDNNDHGSATYHDDHDDHDDHGSATHHDDSASAFARSGVVAGYS
jgi:hypothetical protein